MSFNVYIFDTTYSLLTLADSGNSFLSNDGGTISVSTVNQNSVVSDTYNLTNSGTSSIVISAVNITGSGTLHAGLSLPSTLTSGQTLTFQVDRVTSSSGNRSYTISATDDFSANPFVVNVNFIVTTVATIYYFKANNLFYKAKA